MAKIQENHYHPTLRPLGKPAYRKHKKEHLNGKANSEEVKRVRGAKAKRPPSCKWTKRDFSNLLSEYYPLNFKDQKPYSVAKMSRERMLPKSLIGSIIP